MNPTMPEVKMTPRIRSSTSPAVRFPALAVILAGLAGCEPQHRFWIGKVVAQFNYSNPGIATLGLIVQTANPDGLSFSDYVQRHIMDPLGRLLTAMMDGGEYNGYRVLEAETVDEMLTPQFDEEIGPGITVGLVWRLRNHGARSMSFAHAGGHMFGWRTEGYGWPELGVTLMAAHNQWSLPDPSPEGGMITGFVEEWLMGEPPDVDLTPATGEWAWKVSYVRGVVYAAMFRMYVGVEGEIPADGLEDAIASTRVRPGGREDWDPDGFREGVSDIREAGFGYEEVNGFWASAASRVTVEEAEVILRELGARFPGSSAVLFPPARGESR